MLLARTRSGHCLGGGWTRAGIALCVSALLACVPAVDADVFHLRNGGTVEGQLVATEGDVYRVRTAAGLVGLPVSAVERTEAGSTALDEYDRRVRETADTPADQTTLGLWCAEHGLRPESKRHLQRAVPLDADCEAARRALGYVRAGTMWVDARAAGGRKVAAPESKETDAQRLARAIRNQWYPRIAGIKSARLDSDRPDWFAEGRAMILAIKDPLAIQPLADVLGRGDIRTRRLLVEALAAFPQDEATMNLAALSFVDADADLRRAAITQLGRRDDRRIVEQYREALHVPSDVITRRAAFALGELKATEAIPELIDGLTVERNKWVEVPVRQWWWRYETVFNGSTVVQLGGGVQATQEPEFGIYLPADVVGNDWQYQRVTVYRTELLEALRRITGQDFGFDRDDWLRWYEQRKR